MSSIMRRRSGLMAISVIGGSCLEDGVANSSILKTGRRPHHHPFTSRRSSRALPCAQRPPARAGSYGRYLGFDKPPHLWGGWAEYVYVDLDMLPGTKIYKLPDAMPLRLGALSEPITSTIRG